MRTTYSDAANRELADAAAGASIEPVATTPPELQELPLPADYQIRKLEILRELRSRPLTEKELDILSDSIALGVIDNY